MFAMFNPMKISPKATLALLSAAGVALVASRYFSSRKISAAERLAEALLDTERLRDGAQKLPDHSEAVLAACAGYLVNLAYRAAEGVGLASGLEDPVGYSRTHSHPYTHATATILTEANGPEHLLTYAVTIPNVGEVRGTRRVGALHMSGMTMARPAPDTLQITLPEGYTAQLESEFETPEYLLIGRNHVFGAATLRDNRGNVGRLNISYDGTIAGTVTRDARVIGRFEGKAQHGLYFKQYQLEPGG
jgi:hypothetical protein